MIGGGGGDKRRAYNHRQPNFPLELTPALPHLYCYQISEWRYLIGGDLVSTWVAKPKVHADGQVTS